MFSVKDIRKLVVVSIIGACAVFVANLFLNFYPGFAILDGGHGQWDRLVLDVDPSHVFLYQTICR